MRSPIVRGVAFDPQPVEVSSIADLLRAASDGWDGEALVFPNERVTYPQLEERAHDFARGLCGLGVRRCDKIAIYMPNSADYIIALLGIAKLGAVAVPINGHFKAFELRYVIGHSDCRVLLTATDGVTGEDEFGRILREVYATLADQDSRQLQLEDAPQLRNMIDLGVGGHPGMLSRSDLAAAGEAVASAHIALLQSRVRVREPALLLYTSGTTALPKGCVITHEAIVRQGRMAATRAFCLAPGEALFDPLPIFHTGGLTPIVASLSMQTVFCHPGYFNPVSSLEMIERERCTILYVMFDTLWVPMIDHPRFEETDLSSARGVYLVGPPDRMRWYQGRTPTIEVLSAFGMTEVCAHLAVAGPQVDEETRLTTAGFIQPEMEARIIDPDTGDDQPAGVGGELLYRGPCMFDGYYKQPDLTAQAIDADGWFHSGDRGEIDEFGRFVFRGRVKDMLKVGGENVSPLEIEGYLAQHPAVAIAQVVPAPDAYYAEVPAAFIQLRQDESVTAEELIAFCVGAIATFKVPRYVRFVTEWPMSGTKIKKFVLREQIAEELRDRGIAEAPRLSSDAARA